MIKRTVLLSLLVFIAACDSSGIRTDDLSGEALIPLQVGNEWIWQTTVQSFHTGEMTESTRYDTTRVVEEIRLEGESWARLTENDGEYLATNRRSGYWQRLSPEVDNGDPNLIYKYPADVGDVYSRPSFPDPSVIRVASLDTTITVPAGTFQAVHYVQIWDELPITCDFFVAPGAGVVKKILPWIQVDTGEIVRVDTQELISFTTK